MKPLFRSLTSVVLFAFGSSVLLGCGGGDGGRSPTDPVPDPPVVTSIEITPGTAQTVVGDTTGFTALVRDQQGRTMTGVSVSFSSSNPTSLVVSAGGQGVSLSGGDAAVIASAGSTADTATVTVSEREVTTGLPYPWVGILLHRRSRGHRTPGRRSAGTCPHRG